MSILDKAIDRLVREGKVVRTTINGEPGVKLVNKDEPFGRQPQPVIVTLQGERPDTTYWGNILKSRCGFKGDATEWISSNADGSLSFKIYPRAVND